MNSILFMASDFIDRMSNPSYGIHVNEEYRLRFANLLLQEGFEDRLVVEITKLDNIDSLSGHGWLWLLGVARSKEIILKEDLLFDLIQRWHDVFIQAAVIDVAIRQNETRIQENDNGENEWLNTLIRLCTTLETNQGNEFEGSEIDVSLAQNVLIALLQVGHQSSIRAASRLLNTQWQGQAKLSEFFRLRLELFDEETRSLWLENIDFPYNG